MVERLLVGYDGSDQSRAALQYATGEWPDATYLLVYVIDPTVAGFEARGPAAGEEWYESRRSDAERTLAEARETTANVTGRVETRVTVGSPATELVEVAEEWDADHVVVGSHGRTGVSRILLGSVAERIARSSPTPVTVVR